MRFNAFHLRMVARMEAHLKLRGDNLVRTPWLGGALLLTDAAKASTAARNLLLHLDSTAPRMRTKFETCMAEDQTLMEHLTAFAAEQPPVFLWKSGGCFAHLFKFLADRFLANPDSVLGIERQHAVWQWVLSRRRAIKLKSMNA